MKVAGEAAAGEGGAEGVTAAGSEQEKEGEKSAGGGDSGLFVPPPIPGSVHEPAPNAQVYPQYRIFADLWIYRYGYRSKYR